MLYFRLSVNRYCLGLSNELLFITITQRLQSCYLSNLDIQKRRVTLLQLESDKSNLLNETSLEFKMSDSFFKPPTLTGHSFAAPWPMIMNSSSFESPKSLKNSIIALLRYVISIQSTPIWYHKLPKSSVFLVATVQAAQFCTNFCIIFYRLLCISHSLDYFRFEDLHLEHWMVLTVQINIDSNSRVHELLTTEFGTT